MEPQKRLPTRTSIVAVLALTALLAVACGADQTVAGSGSDDDSAADGDWIGDEPDWGDDDSADGATTAGYGSDDDSATDWGDTDSTAARTSESLATDEPIAPPVDGTPLRAGSVDDNADYDGFLDYLSRINDLGIVLRPLDHSKRSIVTVTDANGRPAAGVEVTVSSGDTSVVVRTTADGTVRFHPGFYAITSADLTFTVPGGSTATVAAGEDAQLSTDTSNDTTAPVPLDVLFLLDATGSMGDEIDRLKDTIEVVADRVASLDPAPDVRLAMTLYRDEGDAFVAVTHDFTSDIAAFKAALDEVTADGGGDYPEALDEGLAEALSAPAWRDPSEAVQLVFLVADAPPQVGRQVETPYTASILTAVERGIKIFPIASSESDDQAEAVFRQIAQATGAPFVFLSYGAGGAATGEATDITSTDYEELALDELVVRLIAEELGDLAGGPPVSVPTTVPTTTTVPDGQ